MLNASEIMELQKLSWMVKLNKRTISEELERQKLIELIRCADFSPTKGAVATIGSMFTTEFIEAVADHLIANDVVPVVRCKNCKHYMEQTNIKRKVCFVHPLSPHPMLEDGFCSYGERREGECK